jgi:hypothetical protein
MNTNKWFGFIVGFLISFCIMYGAIFGIDLKLKLGEYSFGFVTPGIYAGIKKIINN